MGEARFDEIDTRTQQHGTEIAPRLDGNESWLPQKLRQFRHVGPNPPRLIAGEKLCFRAPWPDVRRAVAANRPAVRTFETLVADIPAEPAPRLTQRRHTQRERALAH